MRSNFYRFTLGACECVSLCDGSKDYKTELRWLVINLALDGLSHSSGHRYYSCDNPAHWLHCRL